MKIALVYTFAPFIRGGAEILIDDLENELRKQNHDVDIFNLPCPHESLLTIAEAMVNMKFLRFDDYDKVIISKFPCFYIEHKNITFWIFHQFRQVYELWGTEYSFAITSQGIEFQSIVKKNDNKSIKGNNIFTICDVVTNRLQKFNNILSQILYPPIANCSDFYKGDLGDYLYYPSRINFVKRQLLAVQAMSYVKSDAKLIISGVAEGEECIQTIRDYIKKNKLAKKVTIINRWLTDKEKNAYYANSLACIYPTKEEDYGYITLEAFYSHKPVVTCSDSGGPTYFVDDGQTGYITDPAPEKIAEAIDKLYYDKVNSEKMGDNAYELVIKKNINWSDTIKRLLE